jgi:hypothetical protein
MRNSFTALVTGATKGNIGRSRTPKDPVGRRHVNSDTRETSWPAVAVRTFGCGKVRKPTVTVFRLAPFGAFCDIFGVYRYYPGGLIALECENLDHGFTGSEI